MLQSSSLPDNDHVPSSEVVIPFSELRTTKCWPGSRLKRPDEILAQVEAILRKDEKIPAYIVVAAIRIHGSISPDAKRKVLLLFPAV